MLYLKKNSELSNRIIIFNDFGYEYGNEVTPVKL